MKGKKKQPSPFYLDSFIWFHKCTWVFIEHWEQVIASKSSQLMIRIDISFYYWTCWNTSCHDVTQLHLHHSSFLTAHLKESYFKARLMYCFRGTRIVCYRVVPQMVLNIWHEMNTMCWSTGITSIVILRYILYIFFLSLSHNSVKILKSELEKMRAYSSWCCIFTKACTVKPAISGIEKLFLNVNNYITFFNWLFFFPPRGKKKNLSQWNLLKFP